MKYTEKEIREFLYNSKNIGNCKECPCNDGSFDDELSRMQDKKPCGQFRCWVSIHCK